MELFDTVMDLSRGSHMRARSAAGAEDPHERGISNAEREKLNHADARLRSAGPLLSRTEWIVIGLLTLLALCVRFYRIERPSSVV